MPPGLRPGAQFGRGRQRAWKPSQGSQRNCHLLPAGDQSGPEGWEGQNPSREKCPPTFLLRGEEVLLPRLQQEKGRKRSVQGKCPTVTTDTPPLPAPGSDSLWKRAGLHAIRRAALIHTATPRPVLSGIDPLVLRLACEAAFPAKPHRPDPIQREGLSSN